MKKIIALACAALSIAALASCGGSSSNTGSSEASSNSLIGQWAHDSYVYDFTDATNGKYIVSESTVMDFTYEAKNDTLSILYTGNTDPMKLAYKIQGNELTVTDSFGSDVVYTKK
ncbi:MAG: DUF5640 domain-containing protein [Bacteroidales bacterium]|nr:DUF5640 domain-containing protein [Bacteroidales bacterium]